MNQQHHKIISTTIGAQLAGTVGSRINSMVSMAEQSSRICLIDYALVFEV